MTKMTLGQLKGILNEDSGVFETSQRTKLAERVRKARVTAECSAWGTSVLMQIARISAVVNGFPSHIPLKSPNSHVSGLAAVLKNGKWTIGGEDHAVIENDHLGFTGQSDLTFRMVLDALGVQTNPKTLERMKEVTKWGISLGQETSILKETFSMLHDHTVRAAVGHGMVVRADLDWHGDPTVWLSTAWDVADLFPDFVPEVLDGIRPPMSSAAINGESSLISHLLSMSPPDGRRAPDPDLEGAAALIAVVSNGIANRVVTLDTLLRHGVSPDSLDRNGGTALHVLADCLSEDESGIGVELATRLIQDGIDPSVLDDKSRTALDVLREHPNAHEWDPEDNALLALLESHTSLTSHASFR